MGSLVCLLLLPMVRTWIIMSSIKFAQGRMFSACGYLSGFMISISHMTGRVETMVMWMKCEIIRLMFLLRTSIYFPFGRVNKQDRVLAIMHRKIKRQLYIFSHDCWLMDLKCIERMLVKQEKAYCDTILLWRKKFWFLS